MTTLLLAHDRPGDMVAGTARVLYDALREGPVRALLLIRRGTDLEVVGPRGARSAAEPDGSGAEAGSGRDPVPGFPGVCPGSLVALPSGLAGAGAGAPAPPELVVALGGDLTASWRCWPVSGGEVSGGRVFGCLLVTGPSRDVDEIGGWVTALVGQLGLALAASWLCRFDRLTRLANRDRFCQVLEQWGRSDPGEDGGLAVLCVNIDDFTVVNDRLGHRTGDEVLLRVADRFRAVLRPQDLAARLGGDEFAVLLHGVDSLHQAKEIAVRVAGTLAEPMEIGEEMVRVSVSVGVEIRRADEDLNDLFSRAASAMRRAKTRGKARVETSDGGREAADQLQSRLATELPGALERGELTLHYQPVVDLATSRPVGVEALARWQHPELGFVPPQVFIPLAERDGSIAEIGRWALSTAITDLAGWRARFPGHQLWASVNVSGRQLADDRFDHLVLEELHRCGLPPPAVILEVSEGALIDDPRVVQRLERLASRGVRVAVDDFGTGVTSFAMLQRLPVGIIKIDRSFVLASTPGSTRRDLSVPDRRSGFARAGVQVGQSLAMVTVAEGLEDERQVTAMRSIGCDLGQGYVIARPMPVEEAGEWLEAHLAPEWETAVD